MSAHIIAITNRKGGVGKTTTTINLAASLVALNQKVLLIDMDSQGNATTGSGVYVEGGQGCYEVLLKQQELSEAIVTTKHGYDILPGSSALSTVELQLASLSRPQYCLAEPVHVVRPDYDFIFIDCPPSQGLLIVNAMVAAAQIIIPVQCEYYALEGVNASLNTMQGVRQSHNQALSLCGVLRTMYDSRNRLAVGVSQDLEEHFASKVFKTTIPRNVKVAEAPGYGYPVVSYAAASKGSQAYKELAQEVMARLT